MLKHLLFNIFCVATVSGWMPNVFFTQLRKSSVYLYETDTDIGYCQWRDIHKIDVVNYPAASTVTKFRILCFVHSNLLEGPRFILTMVDMIFWLFYDTLMTFHFGKKWNELKLICDNVLPYWPYQTLTPTWPISGK